MGEKAFLRPFSKPTHDECSIFSYLGTRKWRHTTTCLPKNAYLCDAVYALCAALATAFNEPTWGKDAPSNNGFNTIITYYYTKK